ncbi:MAG: hypothetical protein Q8P67_18535, partial [archaeon]|nr:hypothetical protein [archaeon]
SHLLSCDRLLPRLSCSARRLPYPVYPSHLWDTAHAEDHLRLLGEDIGDPASWLASLTFFSRIPARQLLHSGMALRVLAKAIPALLEGGSLHTAVGLFVELWDELFDADPWLVGRHTVNLFHAQGNAASRRASGPSLEAFFKLSAADLCREPLSVLGCQRQVYNSPGLLGVLLACLRMYLDHSQRELQAQMRTFPEGHPRAQLASSLVLAQRSAAIQTLLESLLSHPSPPAAEVVGRHLHQEFIDMPVLAKLVVFQGFHPDLVTLVVETVESMHVCLDFLPELLTQPQLEKQALAIQLGAVLIKKYPTQRSLHLSKLIIQHLTHANPLSSDGATMLILALPSVVQLSEAFPLLTESIILELLLGIQTAVSAFKDDARLSRLMQVVHQSFLSIVDQLP